MAVVVQASTSRADRREEDAIPVSTAPGEFASNDFARQLLASVKQLKEGDLGPFSRIMTEAMSKSEIKKSESLPNVHFNEGPIIGSAIELPRDFIPSGKPCVTCVKPELDLGSQDNVAISKVCNPGKTGDEDSPEVL